VPNNTTAGKVNTIGDGTATSDAIFLPSYYEVFNASGMFRNLFDTTAKCQSTVSDFATGNYVVHGERLYRDYGYGYWWLRSASSSSYVRSVSSHGNDYGINSPTYLNDGVRPALVLALS
jgi:hypothetical protein